MQIRRLAVLFVILALHAACDPRTLFQSRTASQKVDATEIVSVRNDAGFVLVPPGAFPTDTEITITSIANPASVVKPGLLSQVVDVSAGGAQPDAPVRLSLLIDPAAVPDGKRPVIARWEQDGWVAMPTDDWDGGPVVHGQVDHFSWFGAVIEDVAMEIGTTLRGNDGLYRVGMETYTSPAGFSIQYYASGDEAPQHPRGTLPGRAPYYVQLLGASLDDALRVYTTDQRFRGIRIDPEALPTVMIVDLAWQRVAGGSDGEMGSTSPTGDTIWIHHALPEALLVETAAHELFHIHELRTLGGIGLSRHRWWGEAVAEWAAEVVDPSAFATATGAELDEAAPRPISRGLGPHLTVNEMYYAGTFVRYLERPEVCAGIAMDSLEGLANTWQPEKWHDILADKAQSRCHGRDLDELFERFAAHYYLVPKDGIADELSLPIQTGSTKIPSGSTDRYLHQRWHVPAHGATQIKYSTAVGQPGTLVVTAVPGPVRYRARLARRDPAQKRFVLHSPAGAPEMGHPLKDPLVVRDFARKDGDTFLYVVASNGTTTGADAEAEIWLIRQVEGVRHSAITAPGQPFTVSWDPVPLQTAVRNEGALKGYRLYQRTGAGEKRLAQVGPEVTQVEVTPEKTGPGQDSLLVVRAVDRLGNEGPDSVPLPFPSRSDFSGTIVLPPGPLPDVTGGCADIYGLLGTCK